MDDGLGGDFVTITGYDYDNIATSQTITSGIVKGRTYRFQYRAKNINGWGLWSNITYITAAVTPCKPPAPTLISADST
jgi:hypothetical protein